MPFAVSPLITEASTRSRNNLKQRDHDISRGTAAKLLWQKLLAGSAATAKATEFLVNNSTLSVYCKHLLGRHPGFIRTSFGRHEITPAAYIGFPTVTAVTLALGFHRQVYVGYDRVRQGPHGALSVVTKSHRIPSSFSQGSQRLP